MNQNPPLIKYPYLCHMLLTSDNMHAPVAVRSWAQSNSGALELCLADYIEGCSMTFDLSLIGILSLNSMSAY